MLQRNCQCTVKRIMLPSKSFDVSGEVQSLPAGASLLQRQSPMQEVIHVDAGRVALGGVAGVWTARRVPQPAMRGFVIAVGLFLAAYYFVTG